MEHTYAVIMAGGGGTRLWPVSRKESPKQLLPLLGQETLFQSTVNRLENLFPPERILVVTVAEQARKMKVQVPAIPEENYILEPLPRGTASVVALAAAVLKKRDPQAAMAILTADHFIRNKDLFRYLIRTAFQVAEKDYLVTLGITPTSPSTGYGYIEQGDPLEGEYKYPVYTVKRFTEKPDHETAEQMLRTGGLFLEQRHVRLEGGYDPGRDQAADARAVVHCGPDLRGLEYIPAGRDTAGALAGDQIADH